MSLFVREGFEPIEGYRLIERLGKGGFGEVWKSTAPGGLTKAVKFVYGDMTDSRTLRELKSVQRIREVRHPFLISLERFEVVEGQLVIVMELADRSVADRFDECRNRGLPGIPRAELLAYLKDTADALDYMCNVHSLLHLDIKPQNLLLVGGRAKVADFGVIKKLQTIASTSVNAGFTPLYAPPEAFDGHVGTKSDQYSLAIVFQEMLTGRRPFAGETILQLAIQHTNNMPSLAGLPDSDQPIVARSLSKFPGQRFETCSAFVEALMKSRDPMVEASYVAMDIAAPDRPNQPSESVLAFQQTQIVDDSRSPESLLAKVAAYTPSGQAVDELTPDQMAKLTLRPTVFVAVGGIGGQVIRKLAKMLTYQFGDLQQLPIFQFIHIDTDSSAFYENNEQDKKYTSSVRLLHIPLRRTEDYRDRIPDLSRWLDRRWMYNIPRSLQTQGIRPLGRLAFVDNAAEIMDFLKQMVSAVNHPAAREKSHFATGLEISDASPAVEIITSIAGATGGGMAVDLGYAVRQVLDELSFPGKGARAILTYASSSKPSEKEIATANAHSCLMELYHFGRKDRPYSGEPSVGLKPAEPGTPPFGECELFPFGDDIDGDELENRCMTLAQYLFLDIATSTNQSLRSYRELVSQMNPISLEPRLFSLGMRWMGIHRLGLAHYVSEDFVKFVYGTWSGYPGDRDDAQLAKDMREKALELGFSLESLTQYVADRAKTDRGVEFYDQAKAVLEGTGSGRIATGDEVPVAKMFERLDTLIGRKQMLETVLNVPLTLFESKLRSNTEELAEQLAAAARDYVISWVENPRGRLLVAEKVAREFISYLLTIIETSARLLEQLNEEREKILAKLLEIENAPRTKDFLLNLLGAQKRRTNEKLQWMIAYAQIRFEEIKIQNAMLVLRRTSSTLTAISEDLLELRMRMRPTGWEKDQFAKNMQHWRKERPSAPNFAKLLHAQQKDVEEISSFILESVMPDALFEFDKSFQEEVLAPTGGLWHAITTDADGLFVRLLEKTRESMRDALRDIDAALLFLQDNQEPETLDKALVELLDSSAPRLRMTTSQSHVLFAVPKSTNGEKLRNLLREKLPPGASTSTVVSEGDVIICQIAGTLSIPEVVELLLPDPSATHELATRLRTRIDVAWTPMK